MIVTSTKKAKEYTATLKSRSALGKSVCICTLIGIVAVPSVAMPQKSGSQVTRRWPYDPATQPITLTELRRKIRSSSTPVQHDLLLGRARRSYLAEYAAAEYRQQAANHPNDPVLKSAFGKAVLYTAQTGYQPSNQAMWNFYRSKDLMLNAITAIDGAVEGKGEDIAFCWSVKGLSRTIPWSSRSYGIGSFGEGIADWRRAITLEPRYYVNYTGLAFALLTRTSHYNAKEAASLALKATQLAPRSSTAYELLASALFNLKRYEEAYAAEKKSFLLTPDSAKKGYSRPMLKVYKEKADEQRKARGG